MNIFLVSVLTTMFLIIAYSVLDLYKNVIKDKELTIQANHSIEKINESLKYNKLNNLITYNNSNDGNNLPSLFYKNKPLTSQMLYIQDSDKNLVNTYSETLKIIFKNNGFNYEPTCEEISQVGKISLDECLYIKNKNFSFINFDQKGININEIENEDIKNRIISIANNKYDIKYENNYLFKDINFSKETNKDYIELLNESLNKEKKALENKNYLLYSLIIKNKIMNSNSLNQVHLNTLEFLSNKVKSFETEILQTNNGTLIANFYEDKKKIYKNYIDILNFIGYKISIAKENNLNEFISIKILTSTKDIITNDFQFTEVKNSLNTKDKSDLEKNILLFN